MQSHFSKPGLTVAALTLFFVVGLATSAPALTDLEQLGKHLFFDTNLSTPPGMSCASCHDPKYGWTGPDGAINAAGAVMPGVIHTRAGNRKPPSAAYAGDSPTLEFDGELFIGGMFWDGRATGGTLGDPLWEQALGPFLNPVEMKNPNSRKVLIGVLLKSTYAELFKKVYLAETGKPVTPRDFGDETLFELVGKAIAAYERSDEVNPFDSKFDTFWRNARAAGKVVEDINESNWQTYGGLGLEHPELRGLAVFNDSGKCSACHVLTPSGPNQDKPPVFTDFSYDNLGVPKNPLNPFYTQNKKINPLGADWIDLALGGFLETSTQYAALAQENYGKHKVPTLRNVAKRVKWGTKPDGSEGWVDDPAFVKAYGHNGFFKSNFQNDNFTQMHPLQEIVHFYNTRDVPGQGWPPLPMGPGMGPGMNTGETVPWPPPEVAENVNTSELGNLGLVPNQGMPLLRFLSTLSDTSTPTPP